MRQSPRCAVEVSVDWNVDGSMTRTRSFTADVSATGMFIRAIAPPRVGTRIALRIPGHGGAGELDATVVRTSHRGMGVITRHREGVPIGDWRVLVASTP